jgi:hypothetical protein
MNALLLALVLPALAADAPQAPAAAPAAAQAGDKPAPTAADKPAEKRLLFPPKAPARGKNSLDSPGEVARDLAASVEFFEAGQSYYRAYAKGTHTPEENAAFVKFLETYEKEQQIARRTHAALGQWLEKKSKVTD